MRRDNVDLVAVAAIVLVAAAVQELTATAANPVAAVLRVLTGIPLALLLPGYALGLLVLPGVRLRRAGPMSLLRQGMWSIGLSLVVAVLGGLLLNLTPIGLSGPGWTILFTGVTLLAVAATAADRRRQPTRAPVRVPAPSGEPFWRPRTIRAAAYGFGALVAVTAALWLAYSGAAGQAQAGFTQLWLVPAEAHTGMATLGVRNNNGDTERFAVSLLSGPRAAGSWQVTLDPGQAWQYDVPVTAGQPLAATLSQPDRATAPQVVVLRSPPPAGPSATPSPSARTTPTAPPG